MSTSLVQVIRVQVTAHRRPCLLDLSGVCHAPKGGDTGTPLLQPNDQVICQAVPHISVHLGINLRLSFPPKTGPLFLEIAGMVGPGNSPGTLTIDGDFTQGAAGTLEIKLDLGAHDLRDVVGDVFLDVFLDLQITSAFIDAAVNGDVFRTMNWASHTGQFVGPTEFWLGDRTIAFLQYEADGLNLAIMVPAPGAALIFESAVLTLARRRAANPQAV